MSLATNSHLGAQINSQGTVDADRTPEALFGVTTFNRVGPLDTIQPTHVVAHLAPIEGVEPLSFPILTQLVGL